MQAKACILGDIYLARGDAKKGLDVLSANLPKNRDEISESTSSSLNVPEIYSFLLYEFKNRDPVRGEQFYLQNIGLPAKSVWLAGRAKKLVNELL